MRAILPMLLLLAACAGGPEPAPEPESSRAERGAESAGTPSLQERFPLLPIEGGRTEPVEWRYRLRQDGRSWEERWTGWFFERRGYPGEAGRADAWNQYVFGPQDRSGPYEKVIWFVRPTGIELEYLGNSAVGTHYEPPILILPADPAGQRAWAWEGTLDDEPARAGCELVGEERIEVPAGEYRALHYRETHADGGPVIDRWFVRGIGLVKMEQRQAGELRQQLLLTGFRR